MITITLRNRSGWRDVAFTHALSFYARIVFRYWYRHPIELFGEDWMEWELERPISEVPLVSENSVRSVEHKTAEKVELADHIEKLDNLAFC